MKLKVSAGPNLAYLILRIIPSVLCIEYVLNSIKGLSLSRLAWDTVSPDFDKFVLYVKACPLPGKCLNLRQSLIKPGARPTCYLEMQGLIHDCVTAFFYRIFPHSLDVEHFLAQPLGCCFSNKDLQLSSTV